MTHTLSRQPDEMSCHSPLRLTCIECRQQLLQSDYTLGSDVLHYRFLVPIVKAQLTRNIGALYSEIRDEISTAFDDVLDLRGNGEHLTLICVYHL